MSKFFTVIKYILAEKCPNCQQTKVFEKATSIFALPVMKDKCANCNYHFDRESGYFIGAMYISYGLSVAQGILTFLFCYLFMPNLTPLTIIGCVLGVLVLCSKKNYTLSRIIYMYIFPW